MIGGGGEGGWPPGPLCASDGAQAGQPTMGFGRSDQGSFADFKGQDATSLDLLIEETAADRAGVAKLAHGERHSAGGGRFFHFDSYGWLDVQAYPEIEAMESR